MEKPEDKDRKKTSPKKKESKRDSEKALIPTKEIINELNLPSELSEEEKKKVKAAVIEASQKVAVQIYEEQQDEYLYEGDLPHPEIIEGYANINIDFPQQILDQWKKVIDAEIDTNRKLLQLEDKRLGASIDVGQRDSNQKRRGQHYALIVTFALLITGSLFAFLGHPKTGGTIIVSTLVALAGVFLFGKAAEARMAKKQNNLGTELEDSE